MPPLRNFGTADVSRIIPNAEDVEEIGVGGQKRVFKATVGGVTCALKFAEVPDVGDDFESEDFLDADFALRVKREVETMRDCNCPHIVQLGPIGLEFGDWNGQHVLYFSEELIEGSDLRDHLRQNGRLDATAVKALGLHMSLAIEALWALGKIHRDIKPANIMRRAANGDFVLLDAGLVFDVTGESASMGPVGTPPYFSPEQFDFANRRALDFRSDLFSLGVTMYEMLTGVHPFWERGDQTNTLFNKIVTVSPQPPMELSDGPEELGEVILRLLGKSPHLRYRRCSAFTAALNEIPD